jgi:hypothetical protein
MADDDGGRQLPGVLVAGIAAVSTRFSCTCPLRLTMPRKYCIVASHRSPVRGGKSLWGVAHQ